MNSKELAIINNRLPAQVVGERTRTMMRWLMNFSGDIGNRIPPAEINVENAITEHRIVHLKATFDLKDFLNIKERMNARQILDTAEMIIEAKPEFSLTAIQDCFNRIKRAEYPYDGPLFNSLDGRKLMEALNKYDTIMLDHIYNTDEQKKINEKRSVVDHPDMFKRIIKKIQKDAD